MSEVDKLQALLSQVQRKRGKEPDSPVASHAGRDPAPTPLELAVAQELQQPARIAPSVAAVPTVESYDPPVSAASRPVAVAVSSHLPIGEAPFGQLLRRTLALRPR